MPSCAIITCRARSQTLSKDQGGISFHKFPKEPNIKEKWIDVTGRDNWFPTPTSTICSNHFEENDFIIKKSGYRYLKPAAIPKEKVVHIIFSKSTPINSCHATNEKSMKDDETNHNRANSQDLRTHFQEFSIENPSNDFTATNSKQNYANTQDLRTYFQEFSIENPSKDFTATNSKQNSANTQENVILSNASTSRKRKLQNIINNKDFIIKKQRLQIKRIQAQNRRLKVKINKIEEVLRDLQEKFSVKNEDICSQKLT